VMFIFWLGGLGEQGHAEATAPVAEPAPTLPSPATAIAGGSGPRE
jgi:hypothetical protein